MIHPESVYFAVKNIEESGFKLNTSNNRRQGSRKTMANIIISAKPARITMGPIGFIVYAEDFLNAYKSFKIDKPFLPVKYYLICRSVELSLKSYLLFKSVSIKKVKCKFGHDLQKILKKSIELGIGAVEGITDEEQAEIEKANNWYNRKGFEYFDIQNTLESKDTLPNLSVVFNLADRLINSLKPIIERQ
ncbi:hypothetical protein [Nitrosomonas eutropha]|uniref:hypothetical protein n=1 Tax=Nitrosomonas eutropha TaxID=916 RepID=UPI0008BF1907|nr:hypothetical protein [Nitrosomonas eutropha]SEI95179.1 hypothetical protein SAMN05216318_11738 [Nitrosomonas eutropha]